LNVICHIYLKSLKNVLAAGNIGEILETVCKAAQRSIVTWQKTAGKAAARGETCGTVTVTGLLRYVDL